MDSELQHKMCKKIAQLTKVIFFLNSKNDQYEYYLRNIVNSYEFEMENLFKTANNSIMKYKTEYEKLKSTNQNSYEKKMEETKKAFEGEKKKSMEEFKKYKESQSDEMDRKGKESRMRLAQLVSEFEGINKRLEQYQQMIEHNKKKEQEMKAKYEREMGEYVKE